MATKKVTKVSRKPQRRSVKKKIPKVFKVSRKTWFRGLDNALLLNGEGNMCCLGFVALQCGLKKKDILGTSTPENIIPGVTNRAKLEDFLIQDVAIGTSHSSSSFWKDTKLTKDATEINDSSEISERVREARLSKLFATYGKKMVFVP